MSSPRTSPQRCPRRAGFTLVEALLTLTLTAMAGSVLLMASHSTLHVTDTNSDETIARGIAQQLMDEILCQRYHDPTLSPYSVSLGPNSWEAAGEGRSRFNDIDDYHGYQAFPLEDVWGQPLGQGDDNGALRHASFRLPASYFNSWAVAVRVYYVEDNDHSQPVSAGASNFRAIEVRVGRMQAGGTQRELAALRRVVGYVPPP